jgi:hypothetical protein
MYNQPNWFYVSKVLDYESSFWIQPPTNFHGSEPYLPFALFTRTGAGVHLQLRKSATRLRRVRLSQGIRRLCGELMLLQKAVLLARGFKPNLFNKFCRFG